MNSGGGKKRRKTAESDQPNAQPLKVDVGASAKINVSAKYEVNKRIEEKIPEDVTRAKASAWLTIISPITQWAGLKGDALAHKRELLRLQQEETLAEIALRAKSRIEALESAQQVPAKFLVPFLEKASLEEPDSDLVDLWANLLVSSAEEYNPHYVHFSTIISQLSAQQAKIFIQVLGTDDAQALELAMDELLAEYLHNTFMQEYLLRAFNDVSPTPDNIDVMWDFLEAHLDRVGTEIVHLSISGNGEEEYAGGPTSNSQYEDDLEVDFQILQYTGLVRYVDAGDFTLGRWTVKVMLYYVTPMGRTFAKACKLVG